MSKALRSHACTPPLTSSCSPAHPALFNSSLGQRQGGNPLMSSKVSGAQLSRGSKEATASNNSESGKRINPSRCVGGVWPGCFDPYNVGI